MGDIDLCARVSEVNLVGSNPHVWWINTGATRHVCSDKAIFSYLKAFDAGEKLYMGNSATSTIEYEGTVILKMTSGKNLTLKNELYMPNIRKNPVSGSLLNKHGLCIVIESDKVMLSKSGMFVGKGYVTDGFFKLNVLSIKDDNKMKNSSAYLLDSPNLCTAYRFLMYDSNIPEIQKNTIMESRNASFFEMMFPCNPENEPSTTSKRAHESIDDNNESEESEDENVGVVRRSKRQRTEKSYGSDFMTYLLEEGDLKTYKKVVTSPDGPMWKESIKNKVDSILQNHTWELVDLPNGCKPLDNRWVFKKKLKTDGFIVPVKERKVCRLVKSLYGLKQALMKWHEKFDEVVLANDFKINECDRCAYYKDNEISYVKDNDNGYVMMTLYVDDLLIA
ncbi:uncharacterized protein LOC141714461 [Apium graveolens]|uniref:uncharacterized protein LOC141714461 n=1 Tax=Apium graveolens TaxID=4045 RepID=UPI003D7A8AEA